MFLGTLFIYEPSIHPLDFPDAEDAAGLGQIAYCGVFALDARVNGNECLDKVHLFHRMRPNFFAPCFVGVMQFASEYPIFWVAGQFELRRFVKEIGHW